MGQGQGLKCPHIARYEWGHFKLSTGHRTPFCMGHRTPLDGKNMGHRTPLNPYILADSDLQISTTTRAKRLLLHCSKRAFQRPQTPQFGVRFAHGIFDWEGCSSPLPNPPQRPTTASNHGNGRQHDRRKPKNGLQEEERTVGNHGNGQAITDPKKLGWQTWPERDEK